MNRCKHGVHPHSCPICHPNKRMGSAKNEKLEKWIAEPSPFNDGAWDVCNQVRVICTINNACGLLPTEKQEKIARLIAAAPDLLERIKVLESRLLEHIKGHSLEAVCDECASHYWYVDDEVITCPFCNPKKVLFSYENIANRCREMHENIEKRTEREAKNG